MAQTRIDGAVILGGDFLGLGIIRCLSDCGIPCFLVDYEFGIAKFSRYVGGRAANHQLLDPERFTDYLIALAQERNLKGWVLYPTKDEMVKYIALDHQRLGQWYKIPFPPWEVVRNFYQKENAYRIARSIDIPIPKMYEHKALSDLLAAEIAYPIVLKPTSKENYYEKTKKKAVLARNREELVREYTDMSSFIDPSRIVIQEMIEGGPQNLYSYATFFDGRKSIAGLTARRPRQHPMDFGHATTYAVTVDIPEIAEMGNKLLEKIGYWGIAEVEFMWDQRSQSYKFIEINGRFWGWHTLARAAGINFPEVLHNYMHGVASAVPRPILGAQWMRAITDVPTVLRELVTGRMSVAEYLRTLKGRKEFAVFSLRDPLPSLIEIMLVPYLWAKRGF